MQNNEKSEIATLKSTIISGSIISHSEQAPYYKYRVPYSTKMFIDICNYLQIKKDSEVIDAGCGTGHVAEQLINFVKHVHAVDGSEEMIKHASKFQNVSYYISDLNTEEFKVSKHVDHIFFGRSVHHFASKSILSLVNNNLKNNGSLITCSSEWFPEGGWGEAYYSLRKQYEEEEKSEVKPDITGQSNLPQVGFINHKKFVHAYAATVDIRYLSRLTLARAYRKTLKNLLRDFDSFEREMSRTMLPYLEEGKLKMIIRSWAFIWKKSEYDNYIKT